MKFVLWILPVVGLVLGYLAAYALYHGSLQTWHFIGRPGEAIARILGIRDANTLVVETVTGEIYSLRFMEGEEVVLSRRPAWEPEGAAEVDPVRHLEYYGADFYSLPPPFRVRQLYETAYIYDFEGKGEVKFALEDRGNLWLWKHHIDGMTGAAFLFFPSLGFLAGLVIALVAAGLRLLARRRDSVASPSLSGGQ